MLKEKPLPSIILKLVIALKPKIQWRRSKKFENGKKAKEDGQGRGEGEQQDQLKVQAELF